MDKKFLCKKCNKEYKNHSGLWKHLQTHDIVKNIYKCNVCSLEFNDRQKKYRHQKTCSNNNNSQTITNKKNINSNKIGNHNSGEIKQSFNKNIYIFNIAGADAAKLTLQEIKQILNSPNKTLDVIEKVNFNERLPEFHSFCCKNINGKEFVVYDKKNKKKCKLEDKKEFSKTVQAVSIEHLETCVELVKDKISDDNVNILTNFINDTKKKLIEKPLDKKYVSEINRLSYNKRYMVLDTWNNICYSSDSSPDEIQDNYDSDDSDESKDSFYIK